MDLVAISVAVVAIATIILATQRRGERGQAPVRSALASSAAALPTHSGSARDERVTAPEGFHELAYRSALVPLFGSDVSGRAMAAAAKLVGRRARIDAVYVLKVPRQLPLDASLEDEEQLARTVLETARLAARAEKLKIRTSIVRTRNPGAAVVEEARRLDTEVIYLATDHAPADERALGPTALYLLARRPCRVVIETMGGGAVRPAASTK